MAWVKRVATGATMSERPILVINAGSSSLKYQLVRPGTGEALAKGLLERIGEPEGTGTHTDPSGSHTWRGPLPDHAAAFARLRAVHEEHHGDTPDDQPVAVGHRVVHGGQRFSGSTVIDAEMVEVLRELIPLAPLHNPANIVGIERAADAFPDLPQVAVFDTAFHADMPQAASTYAVPKAWRTEHGVRRYGFHGTSHSYVSRRTAELLERPLDEVNSIVLHLGNGASACAVAGGRSVDTSMGLTPLDGLVMGTRPGDLDPGLGGHMARAAGIDQEQYERALSTESGLLGLSGSRDFRDVTERYADGDPDAVLTFDVVLHRLLHYIGGLAAVLGRLDAIAFTGGIGEHSALLRSHLVRRLTLLDARLDDNLNAGVREGLISTPDSGVAVLVVPTNEEWEIARETAAVIARSS